MSVDPARQNVSVLFVDDDPGLRKVMESEIARMGFSVDAVADVTAARKSVDEKDYDVIILDLRMPRVSGESYLTELRSRSPWSEVIILTGNANIDVAIDCMKKGAYDFLTKPCSLDQLEVLIDKASEKRRIVTQNRSLEAIAKSRAGIGSSTAFKRIEEMIQRIAPTNEPVLILGESGTGKELTAHEIVRQSARSARPYIAVNCSALSETLLESELFGHERGAFTGADARRIGVFQLANGGTIFLDEIGDMPPSMQAKLLRILQSGEFRPVGGQKNLYVDVRIISATNQELPRMVQDGGFRKDLFYRINTFTIALPPLRNRGDDILELASHVLADYTSRHGRKLHFAAKTLEYLKRYAWPGNIRELENVVKRAAILASSESIEPDLLPDYLLHPSSSSSPNLDLTQFSSAELEKLHLLKMIDACDGNKREAARRLAISNKTLYNKLHSYGFDLSGEAAHQDLDRLAVSQSSD